MLALTATRLLDNSLIFFPVRIAFCKKETFNQSDT